MPTVSVQNIQTQRTESSKITFSKPKKTELDKENLPTARNKRLKRPSSVAPSTVDS